MRSENNVSLIKRLEAIHPTLQIMFTVWLTFLLFGYAFVTPLAELVKAQSSLVEAAKKARHIDEIKDLGFTFAAEELDASKRYREFTFPDNAAHIYLKGYLGGANCCIATDTEGNILAVRWWYT